MSDADTVMEEHRGGRLEIREDLTETGFPGGSAGKELPAMWDTWVWSLGGKIPWRRERLPIPVFWPGESHGLCSPWGHKDLEMTEWLSLHTETWLWSRISRGEDILRERTGKSEGTSRDNSGAGGLGVEDSCGWSGKGEADYCGLKLIKSVMGVSTTSWVFLRATNWPAIIQP